MEQLNDQLVVVQECTTNTFRLFDIDGQGIDGSGFTAFVNNGIAQMTLTGPDLDIQNPPPPNIYTERIYPWLP
jgi:hypothetical protein